MPFRARLLALFAVLFLASALVPERANAQVAGAMLKGTVTDGTGAYVPKAQVSIIDVATRIIHNVITDSSGDYAAANLRPGEYQVRVTATGFSVEVRSGITLAVGAQQVLDISLRVGQTTFAVSAFDMVSMSVIPSCTRSTNGLPTPVASGDLFSLGDTVITCRAKSS